MDFAPIVRNVRPMDPRIFLPQMMNLSTILFDSQVAQRLSYDAEQNTMFANFEGMAIRSTSDIESVQRVFEAFCNPIGRRVSLIVNYDGFRLDPSVADPYFEMAARLQSQVLHVGHPLHQLRVHACQAKRGFPRFDFGIARL